jgi:hypothetical protein
MMRLTWVKGEKIEIKTNVILSLSDVLRTNILIWIVKEINV